MLKKSLFALLSFSVAVNMACTTTETTNVNANNTGTANQINPANLPPGFSTNTIPLSTNATPGIPNPNDANANKIPSGNIPGIPDPNKIGKTPQPKNTPPIPGIPDQETIKRQMNTPIKDVNVVNNPSKTQSDVNKPVKKPQANRQP